MREISQEALLERRKEASKTSNEHSRVSGQSCILINGGAATAVIAYLSKDKLDPIIVSQVWWSLLGYGVGVIAATFMIFCATQAMDQYNLYWLARAEERPAIGYSDSGKNWWLGYYFGLVITVTCFAGASLYFGIILRNLPLPISVFAPG